MKTHDTFRINKHNYLLNLKVNGLFILFFSDFFAVNSLNFRKFEF